MNLKKLALGSVLALAAAAAVGWQMLDKETRGFLAHSVAKSLTATLVGAAVRDGHIRSMDDKVASTCKS